MQLLKKTRKEHLEYLAEGEQEIDADECLSEYHSPHLVHQQCSHPQHFPLLLFALPITNLANSNHANK